MSSNFAVKTQALVSNAGEIIFAIDNTSTGLSLFYPHHFVDIVSLDAEDGNPVTPLSGTYTVLVERVAEGGFQSVTDNPVIDASKTGGETGLDGAAVGSSFACPANRIKVVAENVSLATHFRVTINQFLS